HGYAVSSLMDTAYWSSELPAIGLQNCISSKYLHLSFQNTLFDVINTGGLSEGTSRIPRVPDESTVVFTTSSEGTGTKPGVPDEEKVTSEANFILEWGSENECKHSKDSQLISDEEEKKDNDGDVDDED
ncbi:hypothetical protein Tco_0993433, partial [Tanacetum coccineum]